MTGIAAAILLPTLLGFCIVAVLLKDDERTGLLERLALAYPLGAGLLTLQMFLWGLLRVPFMRWPLTIPLLIEIAALAVWINRRKIPLFPRAAFGLFDEIFSREIGWARKTLLSILFLWAGTKLGSIFLETSLRPIFAWDAWANWAVGGKLFFETKGLMLDVPPGDFFAQGAVSRWASYPPHNSLLQAWMAVWIGHFDDVLVKFWTPFYLLAVSVLLYRTAAVEIGRLAGLTLLVLFLSSRLMSFHAVEVYSDLPLGVYHAMALFAFIRAMRGSQAYWLLAGIFSAEALLTKSESPGFIGPLVLSALTYLWMRRKEVPLLPAVLRLASPFVLAAPWFLFKFFSNLSLLQVSLREIPLGWHAGEALPRVAGEFLTLQNFNILLLALPVLLLANTKPSRELLFSVFPLACYALFFIGLYSVTTYYFEILMSGTAFYRNVLTYYPSLCLVTVLSLKELIPAIAAENKTGRPS